MAADPIRKINLVRIAHVYYKYQDVDKARTFAEDFGFSETARNGARTYYRGYGTEPFVLCVEAASESAFGGAAFVVESEEDLHYASKNLPKETKPSDVYELTDAPGGGKCVTFYDPADGFPFHLVHGQTPVELRDPNFTAQKVNYPTEKNRPQNTFQRFEKRPAPVHKLGHFGMCVTDYKKCYEFYSTYFNFFPSELVHLDGVNNTVFFRLNRGSELVDHHCFFFFEGPKAPHVHHSSFETHDFDTQVLGHDWLRHRGYENCWGVGRHIMGSQIFDYWFDPSGFIMEHYVDGDLLDMNEPTHVSPASPDNLHVWGPDLPPTFLT
ncbi:Glyoxalase/Bleomycin resistance protein/Dihydroxybiphenyl dioxygenase [Phialemonium atrogriseum]|uniref:Glyoxalase/Bleomycin resistance protein/Dihydroxybiphenyl dioxygenase n=1 Tax=Phialemonium atrogriseum TaxID=1093897 RepID=A0AAJ0C303_9PEZI|nr:Glyoxalase/Bleomycin resistance protein/Dihydroxybiphenyl dioxygenase [Phialemonium atrogriseum]KAK1768168.1 Glyoxalase/Bleomycin resistance protein/Dihydroxybiphenyl dioxygenase [Phialemonium atrogriseum]